MRALITLTALLALLALLPTHAEAYRLRTAVSDSCHERITGQAVGALLELAGVADRITVPDDPVLERLLGELQFRGATDTDDVTRFVTFSFIVGVRSPDTEGHSTLNLAALRRLHADPAPRGQYAHALRGPDDDGIEGDIAAIDGTLAAIREEINAGAALSRDAGVVEKPLYLDHYGQIEVPVILFAWHIGRAIHALQDAHAHMVWDAELRHVVHVLNYVDGVEGRLEAGRDGMAHSDALDDCDRADVQPMVEAATQRTTALLTAIVEVVQTGDDAAMRRGLAPCADAASNPVTCGWLVYNPACRAAVEAGDAAAQAGACCTAENDYCGSPFAPIAKEDPVGPYLGCQSAPGRGHPSALWLALIAVLALVTRRRVMLTALALCVMAPRPADAEPGGLFIGAEAHGSVLDDRIDSAILAPTFGYAVRAGWRWDRWRAGLVVEHDHWVSVEYGANHDLGVLDVAVFGEALFLDDFVRIGLALGSSTLLFDTLLHDAGTTGLFVEVRPIGLRFSPTDSIHIVFDPLSVAVTAPAIEPDDDYPTLRKVQRRTTVGVEATFE